MDRTSAPIISHTFTPCLSPIEFSSGLASITVMRERHHRSGGRDFLWRVHGQHLHCAQQRQHGSRKQLDRVTCS